MAKKDEFDGYTVNVFLDEEGEYMAHFAEMPNVSAFAETPAKALKELSIAWRLMKESFTEHGEPVPVAPSRKTYSGQFNVRVDRRLHRSLAVEAAQAGLSLNALVAQKLAQKSHA